MNRSIRQLSAPHSTSNSIFWSVLTRSFPSSSGWNFQRAEDENGKSIPLYGTFDVSEYQPCSPSRRDGACGVDTIPDQKVGAALFLKYIPNLSMGDPDPNTGRVRWIQWVRSNHPRDGAHNTPESVIDLDARFPGTPYYDAFPDDVNAESPYPYEDVPSRIDVDFQHDWIAQLFLAVEEPLTQGNTTRTVTLYSGIEWGWINRILRRGKDPVPNPVCPPINNSAGSSCSSDDPPSDPPDGLCFNSNEQIYEPCDYSPSAARFATPDADSSSELTSVPEPTPTAALLAVGAWAGISWRKRKSEQKLADGNIT